MSKAYGRVNYKVLLDKSYGLGLRGIAFDWFRSFLQQRSQCVEVQYTNFTQVKLSILDPIPSLSLDLFLSEVFWVEYCFWYM